MAASIDRQPEISVASPEFSQAVDAATIERTAEALRARGFGVTIATDREDARRLILELIPEGSEVGQGASNTLEEIGVTAEIETSGRYVAIRPRLRSMDRATEGRQIRKLGAAPDVVLNSAQAVTVDGAIVIVSFGGSQLGPIVSGAGNVILAIGAQKIVPDLESALRRVEEHCFPRESERLQARLGIPSAINKVLILNGEVFPGRIQVILIPEAIGF